MEEELKKRIKELRNIRDARYQNSEIKIQVENSLIRLEQLYKDLYGSILF